MAQENIFMMLKLLEQKRTPTVIVSQEVFLKLFNNSSSVKVSQNKFGFTTIDRMKAIEFLKNTYGFTDGFSRTNLIEEAQHHS